MKYKNIVEAKFIERPNRFVAKVEILNPSNSDPGGESVIETVHVKNTGRCKELLIPGCKVWLEEPGTPNRKTKYDIIAVDKKNLGVVNIDSQAPNKVVKEYLELSSESLNIKNIKPEFAFGESRLDFYFEKSGKKTLMEVKGCTLEIDGIGYFPDAPTERGVKHINELINATKEGYDAIIAFVIQMNGIREVRPNIKTHPEFGEALERAKKKGVEVWFMPCVVTPSKIYISND